MMRETFNKVADVCRTIARGLDFTKGPDVTRVWKGINDVWTGYNALQVAFGVAAVGTAGLVSAPTLFAGLGLAIAYTYGRQ
jgi:hypothetical protein